MKPWPPLSHTQSERKSLVEWGLCSANSTRKCLSYSQFLGFLLGIKGIYGFYVYGLSFRTLDMIVKFHKLYLVLKYNILYFDTHPSFSHFLSAYWICYIHHDFCCLLLKLINFDEFKDLTTNLCVFNKWSYNSIYVLDDIRNIIVCINRACSYFPLVMMEGWWNQLRC